MRYKGSIWNLESQGLCLYLGPSICNCVSHLEFASHFIAETQFLHREDKEIRTFVLSVL